MATITRNTQRSLLNWTPRQLKRQALTLCACGVIAVSMSPSTALASDDGSFWTQFTPSVDTRLIFVSSSEGSDSNTGLTPERPVKSLDRAYELLRDGYPDWMLLKRGDVWYSSMPSWNKSGRNTDEKMVIGAYGDSSDRPQIRPAGGSHGMSLVGSTSVEHIAFVGLHIEPFERTGDQGGTGIRWLKASEDILFEDLYIDGFKDNITLQAVGEGVVLRDFHINGCIVVDSWDVSSHSQGIYASGVDGLMIENSVFDHNGWNTSMGASPTIFNHNIYIQLNNEDVVVQNNTIANASSHGLQLRSGGEVKNNLFLLNPISILLGGGYDPAGPISGTISGNLILDGRDMTDSDGRGWAIDVQNADPCLIASNIIYNSSASGMARGIIIKDGHERYYGVQNATVTNNYIYNWGQPLSIDEPRNNTIANISVSENTIRFDEDSATDYIVNLGEEGLPGVSFSANRYAFPNDFENPFRIEGSEFDYEFWQSNIESTGNHNSEGNTDLELGVDSYYRSLGDSLGNPDFLGRERMLSRTSGESIRKQLIQWHADQVLR